MPRKPSLLFIFTDEQRADTLGAYGNRRIRTPNLDRLAAQSVLFENAPESLQGTSLASPISAGEPLEPRDVFVEWNSSDPDRG
jgi:arylsulfatase A-like enzyme